MKKHSILAPLFVAIPFGLLLSSNSSSLGELQSPYVFLLGELVLAFIFSIILFHSSYLPLIRVTGSVTRFIVKYLPPLFFFIGIWSVVFSNFVSFGYIGQEPALFTLIGFGGWSGYAVAKMIQAKWLSSVVT